MQPTSHIQNTQKVITAKAAAKVLGIAPDYVSKLCREGKLKGELIDNVWHVEVSSIDAYEHSREVAKAERAQMLANERRSQIRAYQFDNGNTIERFLLRASESRQFALASFAVGLLFVVASVTLGKVVSGYGWLPASQSAALARVESPFFAGEMPSVSLGEIASGVSNFFASLFAPKQPTQPQYAQTNAPVAQLPATTTKPVATATKPATVVTNTYPVIERTLERVVTNTISGVSQDAFDQALNALRSQIASISSGSSGVVLPYAPATRIDKLSGVAITGGTITSATISGGSISGVSLSTSDLSGIVAIANGGTGTSSAPTYGKVLLGNASGAYDLVATSSLGITSGSGTFVGLTDTPSSIAAGDIFYGNGSSALVALPIGSNGQVLKISGGVPTWGSDLQGSGGAGAWATTTDNLALYPADTTQVVIVGNNATTTTGNIFEVTGNALFRNQVTAYRTITAPTFTATSTLAASTFPYASSTALTVSGTGYFGTASTSNLTISGIASGNLLKTTTGGAVTAAVAGTDFENALTFTYPLTRSTNTISLAFGTTTSNTWGGTQTFTNTPVLGSLSGLVGSNNGALYQIATSTDFVTSVAAGSGISLSGTAGAVTITNTIGYPFPSNATTTTLTLSGGLLTPTTTIGVLNATSSATLASTTLSGNTLFTNATTTSFAISNISSGSLLKTTTGGAITAAVAGTDYTTFGYLFPSNATTTQLAFNGGATFAGATTTALAVTGSTTIQTLNLTNALGAAFGGTGSSTLTGLLVGNGTGALQTATVSSPLALSGTTLSIQQATAAQSGYLSTTDWNTFNNKISSTSLSAGAGISYDSSTGVIANLIGYPFPSNATTTTLTLSGGLLTPTTTIGVLNATSSAALASTTLSGNTLLTNATSTNFFATLASTTNLFANGATTTALAITNISSGSLLKTTTGGAVIAAVAGTDYANFGYLFPSNATTTSIAFNGGLTATGATLASTTLTGNLVFDTATGTNATTTSLFSTIARFTTASTTNLVVSGLGNGSTQCLQINGSGTVSGTGSACGAGGGSFDYPFPGNATTTTLTLSGGLLTPTTTIGVLNATSSATLASTTLTGNTLLTNATSTNFAATNITIGTLSGLLKATSGVVSAAVGGTDYTTPSGVATSIAAAFPFTATTNFGAAANSTSTPIWFTNGLQASSTSQFAYASTTALTVNGSFYGASLSACDTNTQKLMWSNGQFSCATDQNTGGGGGSFPFSADNNYGQLVYSTSTPTLWLKSGIFASSTSHFVDADFTTATTTNLAVTGVTSSLLKTNSIGQLVAAVAGTDYTTFGYLFPNNATTTFLSFGGGASTTQLSVFNRAYFGATGTTTIDSTGAITVTSNSANTFPYASSTALSVSAALYTPVTSALLKTDSSGKLTAAVAGTDYQTFAWPFTPTTNYGAATNSTSTAAWFQGGLQASSTSRFVTADFSGVITSTATGANTLPYASTTALTVSGSFYGASLSTCNTGADKLLWNNGTFSCGTDAGASGTTEINWAFFNGSGVRVATSSNQVLIGFTSTSTNSKLEVVGGATFDSATTTALYASGITSLAGNVGLGTTTPYSKLSVVGGNVLQVASGNPTLAATVATTSTTHSYGSVVSGRYLYSADYEAGLRIIDISNPKTAASVGSYNTSMTHARGVAVAGKYAYVADDTAGLVILDVSNPASIKLVGSYAGINSFGIALSGRYVFIPDNSGGVMRILDVSDPTSPRLVSSLQPNVSSQPLAVAVQGKFAYLGDNGTSRVYAIDISNPASPSIAGSYIGNSPIGLYVSGKYLYVADNGGGLYILNIATSNGNPTLVGTLNGTAQYYGVQVAGDYAYIADRAGNLVVANVSNPASPTSVGTLAVGDQPNGVTVAGKYAYVAANGNSTKIVDINGAQLPTASIGAIESNTANISDNLTVGGDVSLGGGLDVGISGIFSRGTIAAYVASSTQTNPTVASFIGGNVGIGTTSPFTTLSVNGSGFLGGSLTASIITATTSASLASTTLTGNSLFTNATTTSFAISGISSGSILKTTTGGAIIAAVAGTDFVTGAGLASAFPFTATTNFGATANSTSTAIWFQNGLQASSTSRFDAAALGLLRFNATTSTSTLATFADQTFITASTTGFNTGLGISALAANTSGVQNTAVGYQSMIVNASGFANVAVGSQSLWSNVSGSRNTIVGSAAAPALTSGSDNTGIGFGALDGNGSFNVAVGGSALTSSSLTSSYNVALGNSALGNLTTGDGNIAIGYQSGVTVSTGHSNILIGSHLLGGNVITTGAGNVGLGNELYFPSATANNQLNIGGLLFGTLPATSTAFRLPTSGSLGVGTSSPFAKFSIQSNNGDTATTLFAIGSSTASATSTLFSISNTGLISGLNLSLSGGATSTAFAVTGSTTISSVLNIGGQLNANLSAILASTTLTGNSLFTNATTTSFAISGISSGNLLKTTTGGAVIAAVAGTDYVTGAGLASAYPFPNQVGGGNATSSLTGFTGGILATASSTIGAGGQTSGLTISGGATTTGNAYFAGSVGIGTTSPVSVLSLVTGATTGIGAYLDVASVTSGTGLALYSNSANMTTAGRAFKIVDQAFGSIGFEINEFGHTGIRRFGTLDGNTSLEVGTGFDTTVGLAIIANSATQSANLQEWRNSSNVPLSVVTATGTLGIGTSSPFANLSIHNNASSTSQTLFAIGSTTLTGSTFSTSTLFSVSNTGLTTLLNLSATSATTSALAVTGSTTISSVLNVGGAVSANSTLSVAGNVTITNSGGLIVGGATRVSAAGAFLGGDGSAGAPSHSFSNSTTNGMFLATTDTLGFSTGGIQHVTIGSTGNLGVGTTSPYRQLSVGNNAVFGGDVLAASFTATSSASLASTTLTGSSLFTNATTTSFAISGISSGSILKTTTGGAIIAAVAGTDYVTGAGLASAFPFTADAWGNSTSTVIGFTNGIFSNASSTFAILQAASTTLTGLFTFQNATGTSLAITGSTTISSVLNVGDQLNANSALSVLGNATLQGTLGLATSSPFAKFAIHANASSTSKTLFAIGSTTLVGSNTYATSTLFSISNTGQLVIGQNAAPVSTSTQFTLLAGTTTATKVSTNSLNLTGTAIAVQGRYAYLADGGGQTNAFEVWDISNAASSTRVGQASLVASTAGYGIAVQGRYAYVTGDLGLDIFDVSNPASPKRISTKSLNNFFAHPYIQGRYLYIVGEGTTNALEIWDVANPSAPVRVGQGTLNQTGEGIFVQGKYAYLVDRGATTNAFEIWDVSNPASPFRVSASSTNQEGRNVYVQGNYAYLADGNTGGTNALEIWNVSNPAAPWRVSSNNLSQSGEDIFVQGKYAYVLTSTAWEIWDVADPSAPTRVALHAITNGAGGALTVQGRYVYIVNTSNASTAFGIWDLGGAYIQQGEFGGLETGTLSVRNALSAVDGAFSGGLSAGGSLNVTGSGSFVSATSTYNTTANIFNITTASSTNSIFSVLGNNNVGIGTTTPWARLSVDTSTLASGVPSLIIGSSTRTDLIVTQGGAVGVGTSSPFAKFSIFAGGDYTAQAASTLFAIGSTTAGSATTTLFSVSSTGTTTLGRFGSCNTASALTTDASGNIVCGAITAAGDGVGSWFTATTFGATAANATSTLTGFTNGLYALASSTIGGGSQTTGLTISGGATTTGNAYIAGLLTVLGGTSLQGATSTSLAVTGSTTINSVLNLGGALNANSTLTVVGNTTLANATSTSFFTNSLLANVAAFGQTATSSFNSAGVLDIADQGQSTSTIVTLGGVQFLSASSSSSVGNLFLGLQAGEGITRGSGNTGVGYQALSNNTSGTQNTANGYQALFTNTTGAQNTATGYSALLSNTTGNSNTAYGHSVLNVNNAGNNNTGLGWAAFNANTTGSNNTGSGYGVLFGNTTGSNNTANGYRALFSNTTASNNTAFGYQAGYNVTTGYGNVLLGATDVTGGSNLTTGSGNISLGYNAFLASTTANSQLNIGNILFGTLPATSTSFAEATTGAIGVATSSPFAKFAIHANASSTSQTLFAIGSTTLSGSTFSTSTLFSVLNTGAVGIGSSSPSGIFGIETSGTSGRLVEIRNTSTSNWAGGTSGGFLVLRSDAGGSATGNYVINYLLNGTSQQFGVDASGRTHVSGSANASNPGFAFIGDTDTGLFSAGGTNIIGFSTGGRERARLTATGGFTIGTSTSYATTTIWSNSSVGKAFEIVNNASTTLLSVSSAGFGTTTVSGLEISGSATSTSNVGFDISSGCFAVNGVCLQSAPFAYPFPSNATSTLLTFSGGLLSTASSTIGAGGQATGLTISGGATTTGSFVVTGSYASTTKFYANGLTTCQSGSVLTYDGAGTFGCATDQTAAGGWPFTPTTFGSTAANATSTLIGFTQGIYALASSTIGNGTQTGGLTISGGATTTATSTLAGLLVTSGNVGIGTLTPSYLLDVSGTLHASGAVTFDSTLSTGAITVNSGGAGTFGLSVNPSGLVSYNSSDTIFGEHRFAFGGTTLARIMANGRVGIGTTTPYAKLSVFAGEDYLAAAESTLFAIGSTTAGTATTTLFSILSSGNVGIGTSSPGSRLALTQTASVAQFTLAYDSSNATYMRTDSVGDLWMVPSGSDVRMTAGNLWVCTGGSITSNACPSGTPSGQGNLIVQTAAGIGTSTPSSALTVYSTSANAAVFGDNTAAVALGQGTSEGTIQGYTTTSGTATANLNLQPSGGLLGVATSSPWGLFSINPTASNGTAPSFVIGSSTGTRFIVTNAGNVGVGTTSPVQQLSVGGKLFVGNGAPTGMGTATSTFQGDVLITGKLDVSTIDPVYTIDGVKYATYGLSSVGIKEETSATITLVERNAAGKYEYAINFSEVEKGSDLWLFYQVTTFGEGWKDLVANLTPGFDGSVYYVKDPATNTLRIIGDAPGEVSVRLVSSRFDADAWPNLRPDQNGGFSGFQIQSKP